MSSYLKTYQIKLTALSPVHIGCGEKVGKKEFIYDKQKGMLYYPDLRKMIDVLKANNLLGAYENFLLGGYGDLFYFLKENRINYSTWCGKPLAVRGIEEKGFNGIDTFMKDAYGEPYIPGSSMKGAFRTVILNEETRRRREKCNQQYRLPKPELKYNYRTKREEERYKANPREAKDIEVELLYLLNRREKDKNNAANDIMTAFCFSDSKPLSRNDIMICRKIDAPVKIKNSDPKQLPLFRECIKPGTEIHFTLTVDVEILKGTPFENLFEIRRFAYPGGAEREMIVFMARLMNFNKEYRKEYLDAFNSVMPYRADAIYIGGGVGFTTKTMLLGIADRKQRLDFTSDFMNKKFPKHKHYLDKELGVSPHTLKLTKYKERFYEMGKCAVEITEMG